MHKPLVNRVNLSKTSHVYFIDELMRGAAYRKIIQRLMAIPSPTKRDVDRVKVKVAGEHSLAKVPSNSNIIQHLKPEERAKLLPILRRKIVRTLSGVTVVAVMTEPYPCPQEEPCAYCPGGPSHGVPQSYTGHEPAAMRGIQNDYNPYEQVRKRIRQLEAIGHKVDKVELVIMGGTFPSMPQEYQEKFVKQCLNAITKTNSPSLQEAKRQAETSGIRNAGITVETRPDWTKKEHVDHMLSLAVTRVELGVQNIYDDIYERVNRTHRLQDVMEATHALKDAGLKVAYHLMPGLPGSSFERDIKGFHEIFKNPLFKPDMIKIYPCLVLEGTKVYSLWKKGDYHPYTTEEAAQLIVEAKRIVPPWVRIMRVQRDIPAYLIEAGVNNSNLRQIVQEKLKLKGMRCRCIRCREVGHRWLNDKVWPESDKIEIRKVMEEASGGEELFISAEDQDNDVLVGYIRLRIPSENAWRPEIIPETTAIVRELRVYGPLVPVGRHLTWAWQHKGYGNVLLSKAEQTAREDYDRKKLVITSALGTRQYYRRFGYKPDGPYVSKNLN